MPPSDKGNALKRTAGMASERVAWLEEQIGHALAELGSAMAELRDFTVGQEIVYFELTKAQEWIEDAQRTLEGALPDVYQLAYRP